MKNQPPTHSTAEAPDQVLINLKGKHLQLLNFPEKEHVSQLNRECIFVSLLQRSIPANLLPWQTLSTIQSHIYLLPSCSVRCHLQVPVHWALHPFIVTFLRVCVCFFLRSSTGLPFAAYKRHQPENTSPSSVAAQTVLDQNHLSTRQALCRIWAQVWGVLVIFRVFAGWRWAGSVKSTRGCPSSGVIGFNM